MTSIRRQLAHRESILLHEKHVAIYKSKMLSFSETFVLDQALSLRRYKPLFLCARRLNHLPMDSVKIHSISSLERRSLTEALWRVAGWDVSRQFDIPKPGLVHAHFGFDGIEALRIAKKFNVGLVTTIHGLDATLTDAMLMTGTYSMKRYLRRRLELTQGPNRIIAVSNFVCDELVKRGIPREKIRRIYTGIDLNNFPVSLKQRQNVILFVGRLIENKGCEYLLRAGKLLLDRGITPRIRIIGDGPHRKYLQELGERLRLPVDFLGIQSREQVAGEMARSRVLCVPSTVAADGQSEGFGTVFVEASALGTPAVSFAVGGVPEAIEHGVSGLLGPDRDIPTLALNLQKILTDDFAFRNLSVSGMERVRRHFDIAKQSSLVEDLYDEVVDESSDPSLW